MTIYVYDDPWLVDVGFLKGAPILCPWIPFTGV